MIARLWKGVVRLADADVYADYIRETGFEEYGRTAGNLGAWMLRRDTGDRTEFITLSLWESIDAIRAFAGDEIDAAVLYPEDERYLVDGESTVMHHKVADHISVTSPRLGCMRVPRRFPLMGETLSMADAIERGREAFRRRAWADAYAQLSAADQETPLELEHLERLAAAAYLTGRDVESDELWARAHQEHLRAGESVRAARCAFWLGHGLLLRGEAARAGGWFARAQRLLDADQKDCVERGYLLVPATLQSLAEGDAAAAYETSKQTSKIGERFGDPDLTVFGRLNQGKALIALGETAEGVALLDEAMVAVTAEELSPIVAGIVYCAVILACGAHL